MKPLLPLIVAILLAACSGGDDPFMVGQLASDRIEIAAELAEPVTEWPVAEGQKVQAGERLLQQDTARLDAQIDEADATVAQLQARIDELTRGPRKEQIDVARANLAGAERDVAFRAVEYARASDVHEKNLAAADTVDRARAALDAAGAQRDALQAKLAELLAGTAVEELRQAEAALAQAKARRAGLGVSRQRLAAVAPVAGVVDTLLYLPGETPQPGQPMVVMLSGAQPYARVYVSETGRAGITAGTAAEVKVDGLDQTITGHVRWISADAAFTPYFALTEHDRGRLSFLAKIDLDYSGERLPDGVPVEVRFGPRATGD